MQNLINAAGNRAQSIQDRINRKAAMLMQGRGQELRDAGQFDAVNSGNNGFYAPQQQETAAPEEQDAQSDPLAMFRQEAQMQAAREATSAGKDPVIDFLRRKGKMVNDPLQAEYGQQAGSDPNLRLRLEQYQQRQPKNMPGQMPFRRMF